MNLTSLENKLFGFITSFTAPLSSQDLEQILSNYWSDEFTLNIESPQSFRLRSNENIGTVAREEINRHPDTIALNCEWEMNSNDVVFRFYAPAPTNLKWLIVAVLAFSVFFLITQVLAGLFLMVSTPIVFFWFKGVYHHQYKTMVKYFKQDIFKYLLFKQKGFDYFTRKSH